MNGAVEVNREREKNGTRLLSCLCLALLGAALLSHFSLLNPFLHEKAGGPHLVNFPLVMVPSDERFHTLLRKLLI